MARLSIPHGGNKSEIAVVILLLTGALGVALALILTMGRPF